jgi:hypothetical protein
MNEQDTQRASTPVVTVDSGFGDLILTIGRRIEQHRERGSIPDCPEWRAYTEQLHKQLLPLLSEVMLRAQELAAGMRAEFNETPTEENAWLAWPLFGRLQTALKAYGCKLEVKANEDGTARRSIYPKGTYFHVKGGVVLMFPQEIGNDCRVLPGLLAAALVPWDRPCPRTVRLCPEAWRLHQRIDHAIAESFTTVWEGNDGD